VFDRIAVLYDVARPGYPPEVLAGLQACCNLGPASAKFTHSGMRYLGFCLLWLLN
jgi:hypothetical protein